VNLTPQQESELAKQFGFADGVAPMLRQAAPPENEPIPKGISPYFYKALLLVDRLLTVRFYEFVPDYIEVDQSESSETFDPSRTWAILVRTDVAPPIDEKSQNWSGIFHNKHPDAKSIDNYFRWLRFEMGNHAWKIGCYRIAPPVVFETQGDPTNALAPPYIGVIAKFFRKRQDARTLQDMEAQAAVLVPWDSDADPSQRVGKAIVVENSDRDLTTIVTNPKLLASKE
jgi:hypothetical protein